MEKNKVEITYRIETDQKDWLEAVSAEYHLPDESKALRVLLDFAMQDGDKDKIFKEIRCNHCG